MAKYTMRQANRDKSTCVASATYDDKTEQLNISFVKGGSHTYNGVPNSVAEQFFSAGSRGQFFNANIRNEY